MQILTKEHQNQVLDTDIKMLFKLHVGTNKCI